MNEYTPKHSDSSEVVNKKPNKKIIWYVAIAVSAALAAIIMLCVQIFGGKENFDNYKNTSESSTALPVNPIDFDALHAENIDVCAWIKVDGTVIDYPVLQSAAVIQGNQLLS